MAKVLIKESDLRKLTDVYKFLTGVAGDRPWDEVRGCFGDQGLTIDAQGNVTAIRIRSLIAKKLTQNCLAGTLSELSLPEVDGIAGSASYMNCIDADILGLCYMPKLNSLKCVFGYYIGSGRGTKFHQKPILGAWTVAEDLRQCKYDIGETLDFDWLAQATSIADEAFEDGQIQFDRKSAERPRLHLPNVTSVGKKAFYSFDTWEKTQYPGQGYRYRAMDVYLPKTESIGQDAFQYSDIVVYDQSSTHPDWLEYGVLYLTGPNPGDKQRTEAEVKAMSGYPWGIPTVTAAEAARGKGVRIAHSTNPDGSYNYFTVTRDE